MGTLFLLLINLNEGQERLEVLQLKRDIQTDLSENNSHSVIRREKFHSPDKSEERNTIRYTHSAVNGFSTADNHF